MANKLKHLIASYGQVKQQNQDRVLATIIETFGSTYQKAGARMLINPAGEMIGVLGGGCFEGDLLEHARTVFKTGIAKSVFYDMRPADELVWGLGLGCKGAVRILLQLVQAETGFSPLDIFAEIDASKTSGVLVSVYESAHPQFPVGKNLFFPLANHVDAHVMLFERRALHSFFKCPFKNTEQKLIHDLPSVMKFLFSHKRITYG